MTNEQLEGEGTCDNTDGHLHVGVHELTSYCLFPQPAAGVSEREPNEGIDCSCCKKPMKATGIKTEQFGGVMHMDCYQTLLRHVSKGEAAATAKAVERLDTKVQAQRDRIDHPDYKGSRDFAKGWHRALDEVAAALAELKGN